MTRYLDGATCEIRSEYSFARPSGDGPLAYRIGQQIVCNQGVGLIPLCPLNGYFTRDTVRQLVAFACRTFSRSYFFIPDSPTVYTLLARGKTLQQAQKKAKQQGGQLLRRVRSALEEVGEIGTSVRLLDWDQDISNNRFYLQELKDLNKLYQDNLLFRKTVEAETSLVLQSEAHCIDFRRRVQLGVPYVCEELAFLASVDRIVEVERLAYVYHKSWFLTDFLAGRFDGRVREHLGFVLTSRNVTTEVELRTSAALVPIGDPSFAL